MRPACNSNFKSYTCLAPQDRLFIIHPSQNLFVRQSSANSGAHLVHGRSDSSGADRYGAPREYPRVRNARALLSIRLQHRKMGRMTRCHALAAIACKTFAHSFQKAAKQARDQLLPAATLSVLFPRVPVLVAAVHPRAPRCLLAPRMSRIVKTSREKIEGKDVRIHLKKW